MASDPLNLVGTTIAGKYALEAVVGEGGFALVYKAQHQMWKRPVAVKVFTALGDVPEARRAQLLEEFLREGALLADLSERSTAIVQARDVGTLKTERGEELPYMVLEWLEGSPLDAVLAREREASVPLRTCEEAVKLLDPAAHALALAHSRGIAHRDVKPANVFVLGDARAAAPAVKLLDFGIAKVVQDAQKMAGSFNKTAGQVTSFTPSYGAPEQFNRQFGATGPWTDVFALALVFVELVSGKEPLEGDNLIQLAFAASDRTNRPTPRARGVSVSDGVERVLAKAVAVGTNERWQDAGEFWNALHAAMKMAPMREITLPPAVAIPAPVESAKTMQEPAPTAATVAEPVPVTTSPRLAVPIVVVALVALAGGAAAVFTLRSKAPHVAPPTSAPAASAPAPPPPPKPKCPEDMIAIAGGMFFMGSEGPEALDDEKPQHQVMLSPYCIDAREVTVKRYRTCSDVGGCKKANFNEWPNISDKDRKIYDPLCTFVDPEKKAEHPINCVDWDMADHYCKSIGARLPTEAEWEFAARGPEGNDFPWGDAKPGRELLNACGSECVAWGKGHGIKLEPMYATDDGWPNTAPVGSFPDGKSRFGLLDVVGNVWEWTADWHAKYGKDLERDPKGAPSGTRRVIRGGAWNGEHSSWVRPTFRYMDDPAKRSAGIGFRCASDVRP
jgi:formylglycine-generating enzyme required for sulfatase activity